MGTRSPLNLPRLRRWPGRLRKGTDPEYNKEYVESRTYYSFRITAYRLDSYLREDGSIDKRTSVVEEVDVEPYPHSVASSLWRALMSVVSLVRSSSK